MIHKFDNIEALNAYYEEQFMHLTDVSEKIGLSAEETMRNALIVSYNNYLSVVVHNDNYEKETIEKRLDLDRKKIIQNDRFNKKRLNVFLKKSNTANKKLLKLYKKSLDDVEKNELNTSVFADVSFANTCGPFGRKKAKPVDSNAENTKN